MDYTERARLHRHTVTSSSRHQPRHDLHRWTGGFIISSSTYSRDSGVAGRPAPSRQLDRGLCLGEPTFASITMPLLYRPSRDRCADRVPILGITFLRIATTNKPGAINPSIFLLVWVHFSQRIITLVCPSYVRRYITALTRSHGGSVSLRR